MCVTCSAAPSALAARSNRSAAASQRTAAAALPAARSWRQREQRQQCRPTCATPEQDLDAQLQADLERMRQRQAAAGGTPASGNGSVPQQAASSSSGSQGGGPLAGLKEAVDKALIADFFFILFALAWLGAALAERSVLQSTRLLDTWFSLWQWVFQPAIGVLMLGALVSGAVGWAKDNVGGQR